MSERFDELNEAGAAGLSLAYLNVAADGHVKRAVAYLRVAVQGLEGMATLVEQQNAVQRFADAAGYDVGRWYVEDDGVAPEATCWTNC